MKNDFCGWCCLLTTIKCNYQKFAREHRLDDMDPDKFDLNKPCLDYNHY